MSKPKFPPEIKIHACEDFLSGKNIHHSRNKNVRTYICMYLQYLSHPNNSMILGISFSSAFLILIFLYFFPPFILIILLTRHKAVQSQSVYPI